MGGRRQHKKKPGRKRKKGRLIVISAPSGCGKTTVIHHLLERHPAYWFSTSATTRPPRSNERDGCDYYFVTKRSFLSAKRHRGFLEWARVFGHYYGTPRHPVIKKLREGKTVILAVDVKGAKKVRRALEALAIFILPPSFSDLRGRLKKRRTDSKVEIAKRLEAARREISEAGRYDYVVTNRRVSDTVRVIEEILRKTE